jgi:spermidine synthase
LNADRRFLLVLLCFFLSGFAALLYQTAWLREFSFLFGTSELAVVSVLAAYMGGLAAGAATAGRLVGRVRRPVLAYGLLELGIAASALALPLALRATTALYAFCFGSLPAPPEEGSLTGALFHLAASFVILLVPTGLMGATLPLLARYAVRSREEIGRRVGLLYAINTAGAIAGTITAAFVLLPSVGLRHTVHVGVAANAAVFAVAVLLARGGLPDLPAEPARFRGERSPGRWILPLACVSGSISFVYEVLWTRLLSYILGGSVYAFATMLASFLLGITLGSAIAARRASDSDRAAREFGLAQVGIALLALAAYAGVDVLPVLAERLGAGGFGRLWANALVAGIVLLPSTLCIGATFPFAVRVLARDPGEAAAASARVYAWNTVGAIAGAVGAGFLLLPGLGFSGTITAAVLGNLGLAAIVGLRSRPRQRPLIALAVAGAIAIALLRPGTPWTLLRHSPLGGEGASQLITHFGVGRSATVVLSQDPRGWRLAANGLPESRIEPPGTPPGHGIIGRWLALLPVLARPEARSLLLVGLGGGIALEAMPPTLESIDVIELEREVLRANQAIAPHREIDPLSDERVTVRLNDARGALVLTDAHYDAIVSQPSHPWTAGASHLYTREFFSLVRERLAPGGVFVQWIGLVYVDELLLRSLVATLLEVFPSVRLYQPMPQAVLFLASDGDLDVEAAAPRALLAAPAHFGRYSIRTLEDVAAALSVDEAGARRLAAGAPVNTDDHNRLAARSARLGDRSLGARAARNLFAPYDPLPRATFEVDRIHLVRRLLTLAGTTRAEAVARGLREPAERSAALGWVESLRERNGPAARLFQQALDDDASLQDARFGLVKLHRRLVVEGDAQTLALAEGLSGAAAAVVRAWPSAARDDWETVRALEPQLAAAGFADAAYPDAARLRVRWRIASGDPALAAEAIAITDTLLPSSGGSRDDLVLRAEAAAAADRTAVALATLVDVATGLGRRSDAKRIAFAALEVMRGLPEEELGEGADLLRARLERGLR